GHGGCDGDGGAVGNRCHTLITLIYTHRDRAGIAHVAANGAVDSAVADNGAVVVEGNARGNGQRLAVLDGQSIALGDFQVIHDFKGIATVDFTLALGFGDNQAAPAGGIAVVRDFVVVFSVSDNNRVAVLAGGESTANDR